MGSGIIVAVVGLALGGVLSAAGWMLTRRFRAPLRYQGIGRRYPLWHSVLGLLGYALIIVGVLCALVALMLLFV